LQLPAAQDSPEAVQKSLCGPALAVPLQHGWLRPPQTMVPIAQEPPMHAPKTAEQAPPVPTQARPVQQLPGVLQIPSSQHGLLAPPQLTLAPLWQTLLAAPGMLAPEATQLPLVQQPPPVQVLPGQQGWPGPPQARHCVPTQLPPSEQAALASTQVFLPASQQPAAHELPAQQG
jgi:hypothetical protein